VRRIKYGYFGGWGIRNAFNIFVGMPEGKYHSIDLGVDGRIILKLIS
jgi:hypothetical protein